MAGGNGIVPSDPRQLVVFGGSHEKAWTSNLAQIGITQAQLTAFKAALATSETSVEGADDARAASIAATTTMKTDGRTLRDLTSAIVRSIQTYAKNTNNDAVYGLAQIPPPSPRSQEAPPPGQPTDVKAEINSFGTLTLKWKNSNPPGVSNVVYRIDRALNDAAAFSFVDMVGEKEFADTTVPAGTRKVTYIITGKRGQQTGQPSAEFTVRFGVGGPGLSITEQFSAEPAAGKAAA